MHPIRPYRLMLTQFHQMLLNVALCLHWEGLHSPSSHLGDVESLTANEEWSKEIAK